MNAPVAKPETAIAVIDPKSYAAWDPLLDLFDTIRAETPVLRIESPTDDHAPFWLITRHSSMRRPSSIRMEALGLVMVFGTSGTTSSKR